MIKLDREFGGGLSALGDGRMHEGGGGFGYGPMHAAGGGLGHGPTHAGGGGLGYGPMHAGPQPAGPFGPFGQWPWVGGHGLGYGPMHGHLGNSSFWSIFELPPDDDPLWREMLTQQAPDVRTKLEIAKLSYLRDRLLEAEGPTL